MSRDEIELTLPATPKPKHAHLVLDGAALSRETRLGTGRPRGSGTTYPDAERARKAFDAEVDRRMRDGYVLTRDPATAAPGEVLLRCGSPVAMPPPAGISRRTAARSPSSATHRGARPSST